MQNVPVGWGDAARCCYAANGAGLEPSNQTRTAQCGCTRTAGESPHRGVSERQGGVLRAAWMDLDGFVLKKA